MSEINLNIDQYGFIDFNTSFIKYNGVDVFSLIMEFKFKNQELVKRILEYIIPEKRNIIGNVFYLFIWIKEYFDYYMNHYDPNNPISQKFLHGLSNFCEREFFNLHIFDYYLNVSTEFHEFLKFKILSFIKDMNYGKDECINIIDSYHNITDSTAFMNNGLQFKFILEKMDQGFKTVNERLDKVEQRLDKVEQRLDKVEQRLDRVEQRLDRVEQRLDKLEFEFKDFKEEANLRLLALEKAVFGK